MSLYNFRKKQNNNNLSNHYIDLKYERNNIEKSYFISVLDFLFKTNRKKVMVFLFVFFLLFGGKLVRFFSNVIRALNTDSEISNFYVKNCKMEYDIGDSDDEWKFMENVKNKADVFDKGPSFLFSNKNSALYYGGDRALLCSDFSGDENIKNIENVKIKLSLAIFDSQATSSNYVKVSTSTDVIISDTSTSTIEATSTIDKSDNLASTTMINIMQISTTTVSTTTVSTTTVSTTTINDAFNATVINVATTSTSTVEYNDGTSTHTVIGTTTLESENLATTTKDAGGVVDKNTDIVGTTTLITGDVATSTVDKSESNNNIASSSNDSVNNTDNDNSASSSVANDDSDGVDEENNNDTNDVDENAKNVNSTNTDTDNTNNTESSNDNIENIESQQDDNSSSSPVSLNSVFKDTMGGLSMQIRSLLNFNKVLAEENKKQAKIIIQYSFNDSLWHDLGEINSSNIDNAINDGYFVYDAPFLKSVDDIKKLKIKIKTENVLKNNLTLYIDSVWLEVQHEKENVRENGDELVLVDGEKKKSIKFQHTDNNDNENLIIKTDRKNYSGLTETEVYFNIKNISGKNQAINTQFYFPNNDGEIVELKKLNKKVTKTIKTPMFSPKLYRCDDSWVYVQEKNDDGGYSDYYECKSTNEQKKCNELSKDKVICYVARVKVGTKNSVKYEDKWDKVSLFKNKIQDNKTILDKWLGSDKKEISSNFKVDKSSFKEDEIKNKGILNKIIDSIKSIGSKNSDANILKPDDTQYYMAKIKFPIRSSGEFYIEAIGKNGGYGLLDPWWQSSWNYRMPIEINNSNNPDSLSDYQILVQLNSNNSDFWTHVKSDGGDVRFTNGAQDSALDYWIQYWNYASSTADIWVQVDSIPSATTSEIFLYYGNSNATTTSDQYAPFTYSSMQDLFYVVVNKPGVSVEVVSLVDNNQVQLDNQTVVNLDRQELTNFTPANATSTLRAKGPIHAKIVGGSNVDALVPISFASKQFTIASTRGTEDFYSYTPFGTSTINIYDGTVQEQQQTVNNKESWMVSNDISTMAIVEATEPILLSFDNDSPDDGLVPYPATNLDLYGIASQKNYIGIAEDSSFNVYCSGSSSASVGVQSRGVLYDNTTCSNGSQGTADAVRLSNISGKIGAIQQADSDGGESTTFLPRREFSSEYMVPTEAQYLAIVCAPESGSMEISVFNELNAFVASSTCSGSGDYPGKVLFNSGPYNAGTRIVSNDSSKTFYIYYEDSSGSNEDENNLWGAVQSRKYSSNNPTYTIESEEPLKAPTATINSISQDGKSGIVKISVDVNDESNDEVKLKMRYATSSCDFSSDLKPDLATTSVSATYGNVVINNDELYQIGTSSNLIITENGTNTVEFSWNAINDLPDKEGIYCVQITANDGFEDQIIPATSTVEIDNIAPSKPGNLSLSSKTGSSVTLNFGASTSDEFFDEYKIFYKEFDGSSVSESDTVFSSSTDVNLADINYNHATTTIISGLTQGTKYVFNIWAYDKYGHSASSSQELTVIANKSPVGYFNSANQKTDGSGVVNISMEISDDDGDNCKVKIEYEAGSDCDFSSPKVLSLDVGSVSADVGLPVIDQNDEYQIGTSSSKIVTSVGSNTIGFNWLSYLDEPSADGTYCLRLLVNDGIEDQDNYATTTLILDNVPPVATGNLVIGGTTASSVKLLFATSTPATDTNEPTVDAYKLFYKQGTSSVSVSDTEFDLTAFNSYDYDGVSSTTITGLDSGKDYVFNIWSYDAFGAKVSSDEVTVKTDSSLKNDSLVFVNHLSAGTSTNILVNSDDNVWNFRANVSEINGWQKIDEVYLRLANKNDNIPPFEDLEFKWNQSTDIFSEVGLDASSSVALLDSSYSDCTTTSCVLNFNFTLNKNFASTSVNYSTELFSTNDLGKTDDDIYPEFYQARRSWVGQMHYRWRNDNGAQ